MEAALLDTPPNETSGPATAFKGGGAAGFGAGAVVGSADEALITVVNPIVQSKLAHVQSRLFCEWQTMLILDCTQMSFVKILA